ncbi:hypothetical protein HII31_12572 [Pseudocercospora fuligena]|uniref:Uncharacterized protein n=1 Tax=Pseudocercospora fuligena TaxID=685502 RepID=A0A8H6R9T4_9PEZI|nr:hypothetical protein HII31_12572 [Pseudocercospora fuligena]
MSAQTLINTAQLLGTGFGYTENYNPALPRLTNRIHPIFKKAVKELFDEANEAQRTIHMRAFGPAFKLATRFLDSGALDSFFWIFHHPNKLERYRDDQAQPPVEYDVFPTAHCRPDRAISKGDRAMVQQRLQQLAANVHFTLDPNVDHGVRTREDWDPVSIPSLRSASKPQPVKYGFQSTVRIAYDTYTELEQITAATFPPDVPMQLAKHFEFAVTLLHEIAHMYRNFMLGGFSNQADVGEPFLGEGLLSELGFELESRLLGGHISLLEPQAATVNVYQYSGTNSALDGILSVYEWPYQQIVNFYEDGATPNDPNLMDKREDPDVERPLDQAWRIDLGDIARFFTDNFWTVDYPNNRNAADYLWPGKDRGFNFKAQRATAAGVARGPRPVRRTRDDRKYVPNGYVRAANGDIRPGAGVAIARSVVYPTEVRRSARVIAANAWTKLARHPGQWHTEGR